MPSLPGPTGLTITNPLVKYRTLLATKRIDPDPAQHRLAIHLQKLYYRLKDYEPELEYGQRLDQISRTLRDSHGSGIHNHGNAGRPRFRYLWRKTPNEDVLALTRTATAYESALTIQSPQGMLLYGEVGRGKSMLLDLLADSLPNRKKRRWHFNTFMLETFRRLEQQRRDGLNLPADFVQEHSILSSARDMISSSPILFLDEFQLPDRAASKLLSNLMTSFFHLGGVLIATSNRMPEELAKASGIEFAPPPPDSPLSAIRNRLGLTGRRSSAGRSESMFSGASDFSAFLEVLKARCETWEMEGEKDWRREDNQSRANGPNSTSTSAVAEELPSTISVRYQGEPADQAARADGNKANDGPAHFYVLPSSDAADITSTKRHWDEAVEGLFSPSSPNWTSTQFQVYGRRLLVPRQCSGVTMWNFAELCSANLGPADFITLASTYHTFILTSVPVLTLLQKNEARRFITLLDALYEARCKLLIQAQAGPDVLFFPETRRRSRPGRDRRDDSDDNVLQEMFGDIYQDAASPFRPNVSSYENVSGMRRSILADEDADFGPVYGNGRSRGVSSGHNWAQDTGSITVLRQGPDFTKTSLYTGEDERFAYKRARSRLWELCGHRWWEHHSRDPTWWRPLPKDARPWESSPDAAARHDNSKASQAFENGSLRSNIRESMSEDSTSPFRTNTDAPPKFSWVHAWGMVTWGKRAGLWGKGPEGLRKGAEQKDEDK